MTAYVNSVTKSISVSTTTARSAYPEGSELKFIVHNVGSAAIFVKSGSSTVEAVTTDAVVPPNTSREFVRKAEETHLAAITASGTATAYIQFAA